ncbi:MAG: hypothetical protein V4732_19120 [Pseudomonadota bacterium]
MNKNLRSSHVIEKALAIFLSTAAVIFSGGIMAILFFAQPRSFFAIGIFLTIFLISTVLLWRFSFTNRVISSLKMTKYRSWALVIVGFISIVLALVFGSGSNRYLLLSSGISVLYYGLVSLKIAKNY